MPNSTSSSLIEFVKDTAPCLEAEYAAPPSLLARKPAMGRNGDDEARRFCCRIPGSTTRTMLYTPVRLMAMVWSQALGCGHRRPRADWC